MHLQCIQNGFSQLAPFDSFGTFAVQRMRLLREDAGDPSLDFALGKFLLKRASLDHNGLRPAPENLAGLLVFLAVKQFEQTVATCAMKVSLFISLLSLAAAEARRLLYENLATNTRESRPIERSASLAELTESTVHLGPCSAVGSHIDFFDLCRQRRTHEQHNGTLRSLYRLHRLGRELGN